MPKKVQKETKSVDKPEIFTFRVKLGDYEIELKGTHENVTSTIEKLPTLIPNIHKAFDSVKPKTVTTFTVKTQPPASQTKEKTATQKYPIIKKVKTGEAAILGILETDWGKWRPRTMEELTDALIANDFKYPKTALTKAMSKLVNKGMVRRWSTKTGFVYILVEDNPPPRGDKKK